MEFTLQASSDQVENINQPYIADVYGCKETQATTLMECEISQTRYFSVELRKTGDELRIDVTNGTPFSPLIIF